MQLLEDLHFKKGDFIEIKRTLSPFTFLLIKNGCIMIRLEVPFEVVK